MSPRLHRAVRPGSPPLDESAYPLASQVATAAGREHGSAYDPEHAYPFGLQRVLDGLGPLIDTLATVRLAAAHRRPEPSSYKPRMAAATAGDTVGSNTLGTM